MKFQSRYWQNYSRNLRSLCKVIKEQKWIKEVLKKEFEGTCPIGYQDVTVKGKLYLSKRCATCTKWQRFIERYTEKTPLN